MRVPAPCLLCLVVLASCTDEPEPVVAEPDAPPIQEAARLPNLIVFSADAMRVDHLTGSGYQRDTTPELARVARRGAVFDAAFTPFPDTTPAHASMFTGLDPGTHGLLGAEAVLRADAPTLAELLHAQGYSTGGFVSTATLGKETGLARGFAAYDAPAEGRRPGGLTLLLALKWLRTAISEDHPFFLFVHVADADTPYEPPGAHLTRVAGDIEPRRVDVPAPLASLDKDARIGLIAQYDASLSYVDHVLSTIMQQLTRLRMSTTTHVLVTSAHGVTLTDRDWAFDHGGRLYDEQLRVPLILRLGGGRHAGANVASPVSLIDVFATLCALADIEAPDSMPSRSLMGLLGGRSVAPTRPIYSMAVADTKRVPHLGAELDGGSYSAALRLEGFKLVDYPLATGDHVFELFHLGHDGKELANVLPEHTERAADMVRLLGAWRVGTGVMGKVHDTAAEATPQ